MKFFVTVAALFTLTPLSVQGEGYFVSQVAESLTRDEDYSIWKEAEPLCWNCIHQHRGLASVSPSLFVSIQETLGETVPVAPKEGILIQTTVLNKSSRGHTDCYFDPDSDMGPLENDRVAFVMMNTNENAFFEVDGASIPMVQGRMVSFHGGISMHRTVINSGSATLLGPFGVKNFKTVHMPSVTGDPHINKWDGTRYDYHGECDLVMVKSPNFGSGLGLHLHIRTKIVDSWSYVETVALKIGEDVLEVSAMGVYSVNGVRNADLSTHNLSGYPISFAPPGTVEGELKWYRFEVDLKDGEKVVIKSYSKKVFMAVAIEGHREEDFGNSVGLMGTYSSGISLGRDGLMIFQDDDYNGFGQEWQVNPMDDPLLFLEDRPQYPEQKCILPPSADAVTTSRRNKKRRKGRRLSEEVTQQQAEMACSKWNPADQADCIYDVIMTGDLELAEAGGYFW